MLSLVEIADELSRRMNNLFLKEKDGSRAFQGRDRGLFRKPDWKDKIWFHEYFHGDDGSGLGACHQTGWTGLSAELLEQQAIKRGAKAAPAAKPRKRAKAKGKS
jgi:hypothetical protein